MNSSTISEQLKERFPQAILNETFFKHEVTIEVAKAQLKEILFFLKNTPQFGFEVLMDLTGVDYIAPKKQTKVVYWLHNPTTYERVRIVTFVEREEKLPSVIDLWRGANWYERELYDLFGVYFDGHPDLKRILLPESWEGHPLRKDYPLTEQKVAFKHEAKPKIPSQIINLKQNQKL